MTPKPFPTGKFFVVAALSFFLIYGFNPIVTSLGLDAYRYPSEARAFSEKIRHFSTDDVYELGKEGDKPLMLHLYASWCPYCREQSGTMLQLIERNRHKMDVVMLSLDNSPYPLSQFLMTKPQPLSFTPYMLNQHSSMALQQLLMNKGVKFDGGIPFTAIFNRKGDVIGSYPGVTAGARIQHGIDQALK